VAEDKTTRLAELSSARRCACSRSLLENVLAAGAGRYCQICKDFVFLVVDMLSYETG